MNRIDLKLNLTCNQNCVFCATMDGSGSYTNTKDSIKIINNAIKKGVTEISFSGGEPTIRKDLPQLVDFIKKKDPSIRITVLTNAMTLQYENYTSKLKNVDFFNVSLHGATSKTNDSLTRTPGSFEHTISGVKTLKEFGYKFGFYYVITKTNFHEIMDFTKMIINKYPGSQGITFSFPYVAEQMLKNKFFLPKLSNFTGLLDKSKQIAESARMQWNMSTCGLMPLCVLSKPVRSKIMGMNKNYSEQSMQTLSKSGKDNYVVANTQFRADRFVRSKACQSCRFKMQCPGVWKEYAELYGTDELNSI